MADGKQHPTQETADLARYLAFTEQTADPMTHERAENSTVTRWHEQCSATRRDGQPCQAPAIPGGFVCRRHGGSAPQVQIAAGLRLREDALLRAVVAWQANDSFAALCRVSEAERDLDVHRAKLARLAGLRRQLRQQRGTPPQPLPPRNPDGTFRRKAEAAPKGAF